MEKGKEIRLDSAVTQSPGLVVGEVDGEKVMLNIETGKYYALDAIATRIWALMETPCTVKDLVSGLIEEYDVQEETCQHDVLTLLNKLYDQRLIGIN